MARLTIPDEVTSVSFTVTTPTTAFPISFALFDKADLIVTVDDVELNQSGFTFSGTLLDGGGYSGGTVTLNAAVDDVTVLIRRVVGAARPSNFAPSNSVPVGSIDMALNRLTAAIQDAQREVARIQFEGLTTGLDGPAARAAIGAAAKIDVPMERDGRPATLFNIGMSYRLRTDGDGRHLGGLWAQESYAFGSIEATFDATNTAGLGGAPASALFIYAEAAGTTKDVVGVTPVAWATANNQTVFGFNAIAASEAGLTGIKYVGGEIDVLVPVGITPGAGTGGAFINAFNYVGCGPAVQIGGVGGGMFTDGLVIGNLVGAALAGGSGAAMTSLVNSGSANYTGGAAFVASNGHRFRWSGPASAHTEKWVDGSGVTIEQLSSGSSIVRNSAGTQVYGLTQAGVVAIGANASLAAGYQLDVACTINAEGVGIIRAANPSGTGSAALFVANGTDGNAANCAARLRANSVTGRSLNAGGTVNASGADYAEFERLCDRMVSSGKVFAKGDIVGFDHNGSLTDLWSEAVSFGVKSTNPALVGGDEVFHDLPEAPSAPLFEEPEYKGVADPGPTPKLVDYEPGWSELRSIVLFALGSAKAEIKETGASEAAADKIIKRHMTAEVLAAQAEMEVLQARRIEAQRWADWDWHGAVLQFEHDVAVHAEAVAAAKTEFEAVAVPKWKADMKAWNDLMNEARKPYDRIAYCGKVPMNVTGAKPGDWVVAVQAGAGIGVQVVPDAEADDRQIRRGRAWQVRRILDDGRAEVAV